MGTLARSQRPSRPARRSAVVIASVLAVAAAFAIAAAPPAPAASSVRVPTASEAWYQAPEATTTVAGLGVAVPVGPANPYAPGTLHVGVKSGTEDARTYLRFDTASIGTAAMTGATLVLPVDEGDGTVGAETAHIEVCYAPDPGGDADGSLAPPPAADCTLSAAAEYVSDPVPAFVADLSSFADDALRGGGVAILPAGAARAGNQTWHVAFHGKETAPSEDLAIRAEVEIDDADTGDADVPAVATTAPPAPTRTADERPDFSSIDQLTLAPRPAAPAQPLFSEPRVTPRTQPIAATDSGFAYPAVLVLPIALLAVGAVLGAGFTRDPTVTNLRQ